MALEVATIFSQSDTRRKSIEHQACEFNEFGEGFAEFQKVLGRIGKTREVPEREILALAEKRRRHS